MKSILDLYLHRTSLDLARLFRAAYREDRDSATTRNLLEAYRRTRRNIGLDPRNELKRSGASEAHAVIMGAVM